MVSQAHLTQPILALCQSASAALISLDQISPGCNPLGGPRLSRRQSQSFSLDRGSSAQNPALTMEFLESAGYTESLSSKLAGGALPVPFALMCAMEIASSLRELHQEGLAHGEVNPANIWLSSSGARLLPHGNAPPSATTRSDVAAFGAVLYQMLTGVPPQARTPGPPFTPITAPTDMTAVRSDAISLAERCLDGVPDITHVIIELRLLGISIARLRKAPHRGQPLEPAGAAAPLPLLTDFVESPTEIEIVPTTPDKAAAVGAGAEHPAPIELPVAIAPPVPAPPAAPESPAPEPAGIPPEPSSHTSATAPVICPRCGSHAPFAAPHSALDRLLNRISRIRRCDSCGFRFILVRFQ